MDAVNGAAANDLSPRDPDRSGKPLSAAQNEQALSPRVDVAPQAKQGVEGASVPRLLQVVGFKNSGKTTLTEKLLRLAAARGLRASAIKHHGHGGAPDLPPAGTDASRFFEAGAASSLVSGGGIVLLQGRQAGEAGGELAALISLSAAYARPDLILIEGFKEERHDKIVLVRSEEDWPGLRGLANIRLVAAAGRELAARLPRGGAPVLAREEDEAVADWFANWLEGESDESL
ncbi:molybdopterin-guanine dinucleotide biosynthesis protein B [Saccharibacillus sp. CPCC 101409]|uniref:molybdopterin-guanine dinucleotide biosynthesis protein B n=1 Tax=Saccharibacillus sp. CPCC 101409 TaxID=3058041 RepID=UPI002674139A|nr:molybdopterin-guanine dinucleotide biosynthesis protein B [Saccharibacillus sp. CPCC 101409]MDO3412358.1 molybdopterin-guanine dinucleotide biosynthesis protein B [Saccharibacillus sp. CPCC 101409]